nr:MAG TPA: hypothetical protein [Caudoviricetes sp.]
MHTVQRLCDELEKSAQFNEDTLAIKIGLHEENERLRAEKEELYRESALRQRTIDQMKASGYPVSASMGMTGIAPMSPELFRQHALLAAMDGMLASGRYDNAPDLIADTVSTVELLVKELAK